MKLRDLSKVRVELLIELEDFLLDNIFDFEKLVDSTDEEKEVFSKDFTKKTIKQLRDNALPIAKIVFCDERGNDLSDEELKNQPIKLELINKALPEIMKILISSIGGEQEQEQGKSKRVRTRTKS